MSARMINTYRSPGPGVLAVLALQLAVVVLVAGWFATGHASAPDHGLQQLDVLSLHERVSGLSAQDGRPTMVVLTCAGRSPARTPTRTLPDRYGFAVETDPVLARRVALPRAAACQDGYVLLDGDSFVRYRTYDPGWRRHVQEQEVLLDHLAHR